MRYFLHIAYDGTGYSGWQRQPNALTVQEVVEKALGTILRREVDITGAGRTDAGVHARDMVAHVDIEGEVDTERLKRNMNSLLPPDIAINSIEKVGDEAHARFDAKSRMYEYHITTAKDPFLKGKACAIYYPIDIDLMNKAASMLLGTHDFQCFSKVHTDVNNYYCTITRAEFCRDARPCVSSEIVFTIEANRFLRGMVRAIVGTLIDIGAGRKKIEDIEKILTSKDRCQAGQAMPAEGLIFIRAEY